MATILDYSEVQIPDTARSMAKRNMPPQEYECFSASRLYSITYMSEGLRIKAYLFIPPQAEPKMPAVVFNAGGTGERGALSDTVAIATLSPFVSRGYVTIASQYRGRGGSDGSEEWGEGDIRDVMNMLPLVQGLDYVDADRIGLVGGSRGGMMALMMLTQTTLFRAAIVFGAPTTFLHLPEEDYIRTVFQRFLPDNADYHTEAHKRSAVEWADKLCATTPLLVQHGTGDRRVGAEHGLLLGMALQKIHFPYKLIMYDNADHVLAGRRTESAADMLWWLDTYVRNRAPLPKTGPHGA
jgi:dipeptidyl aminopeptidase/acylaminoacyl peptidase